MKLWGFQQWRVVHVLCVFLALLLFTSCATTPKVNWNTRIGNYTYDQVVLELGPPEKTATLQDGTRVGDWLIARGYSHGFGAPALGPYPAYPYFYGPPSTYYSELPSPDRLLRLTFSPDGKLASWKNVFR